MPELPDVEVYRRRWQSKGLHKRVRKVHLDAGAMLEGVSRTEMEKRLSGAEFGSTRRHGKHLFVEIANDGWLHLHFGMTGNLMVYRNEEYEPDHPRMRLDFIRDEHLVFEDLRRFGRLGFVEDVDEFVREAGLGIDPLSPDFDLATFRDRLADRRGAIKSVLMNQKVIAGLGNIYVDEVLFQARLHPESDVRRLKRSTIADLHRAIRDVLHRAIDAGADVDEMPSHYLLASREKDGSCPRCGRKLKRAKVAGRTTYYCPHDQRRKQ
jgi:formamidopyrimidine-DNA glycosylase